MDNYEKLKNDYDQKVPIHDSFCKEIVNQINYQLIQSNVSIGFPVEYRVKKWNSITQKCQMKGITLNKVDDLADFAGVRIIVLFKNNIDKVEEIIKSTFEVQNIEIKNHDDDDRFGYSSIHYQIMARKSWGEIATLKQFVGLSCELQLRTAAQHIWAATSHILQYKKESDIPSALKRGINRLAAMLEIVDSEFERIFVERDLYVQHESKQTQSALNVETLKITMDNNFPIENREQNEDYSQLLEELNDFNVKSTVELEQIIKANWKKVLEEDRKLAVENTEVFADQSQIREGVWFNHSGLLRTTLLNQFGKEYSEYLEKKYNQFDDLDMPTTSP